MKQRAEGNQRESKLSVATRGEGIVTLTLDRPERHNALSMDLRSEVAIALGAIATDPDSR